MGETSPVWERDNMYNTYTRHKAQEQLYNMSMYIHGMYYMYKYSNFVNFSDDMLDQPIHH